MICVEGQDSNMNLCSNTKKVVLLLSGRAFWRMTHFVDLDRNFNDSAQVGIGNRWATPANVMQTDRSSHPRRTSAAGLSNIIGSMSSMQRPTLNQAGLHRQPTSNGGGEILILLFYLGHLAL